MRDFACTDACRRGRGYVTALAFLTCVLYGSSAVAQAQAPMLEAGPAAADPSVTEFDAVEVTARRPVDADPLGFREPPPPTVFDRTWREPFDLEEIGMRGGLVMLGINYALGKAAQGVTQVPGWKQQIQPATARPPPLDEAMMQRAAALTPEQ